MLKLIEINEGNLSIETAFGSVVRRLRRERNLTQDVFALNCGLDRSFLCNIESGKQQPSLVTIFSVANALDLLPSTILKEVELLIKYCSPKTFESVISGLEFNCGNIQLLEFKQIDSCVGHETILIADDDIKIINVLTDIFISHGYNVLIANDGFEAMRRFNESSAEIKLILIDIVMPNKSGIEVYKDIMSTSPKMNIILSSGYRPDFVNLPDGCIFIKKPLIPHDLLKLVRATLDTLQ
jgi:CheY-like chemotaxis protein/transcriptional regulator with XRE-family HTH domain